MEGDLITGIVKWYNSIKGYGFIQPENGGNDVFVHVTALEAAKIPSLAEGQRVNYKVAKSKEGKFSAVSLEIA